MRRRPVFPLVLSACGLLAAVIVGSIFVARSGGPGPAQATAASTSVGSPVISAPAVVAAPVVPVASVPLPAMASAPVASVAPEATVPEPSASTASPDHGELRFPPFAAGHRIFVDGHVVGDGAQPALVRCGPHEVRIGSAGTPQQVTVPCGGSVTVTSR
jgi:hypothetical protein